TNVKVKIHPPELFASTSNAYNDENVSISIVDKVPGWSPRKPGLNIKSNMCRIPVHKPRSLNFGQSQTDFDSFLSCNYKRVNSDILSVSDTVWRTNNVLEVSHRHLQMHVGNRPHPEPWMFLNGLITYSRGVLVDYDVTTDGGSVREPQRQVWIDQQRKLDLALRLFTEGRYPVAKFLICARHSTPAFSVLRPEHQAIPIVPTAVLPQAPPIQAPLPINQIFDNITPNHSDKDDDSNERSVVLTIIYLKREDLTIVPKVEEKCYICLNLPPTVVAYPCSHQGLCKSCHESYITMPPNVHRPYYRYPLCRSAIDIYYSLQ
ncbi:RING-type domain-containing protein, partial [Aphis craccivora]